MRKPAESQRHPMRTPPSPSSPNISREPLSSAVFGCLPSETLGPLRCSRIPPSFSIGDPSRAAGRPRSPWPNLAGQKKKKKHVRDERFIISHNVLPLIHFSPLLHLVLSEITVGFFSTLQSLSSCLVFFHPGIAFAAGELQAHTGGLVLWRFVRI